jgi:hypothetical protein
MAGQSFALNCKSLDLRSQSFTISFSLPNPTGQEGQMAHTENSQLLLANVGKLPTWRQGFALSLLSQLDKKGTVSPEQWKWINKLADMIKNPQAKPEPKTETVGDFSGVIALFNAAASKLKSPRITLQIAQDVPLALSLCGPNSKTPGSISLSDGGPYKNNRYYGRVSPNGVWVQARDNDEDTMTAIGIILTAIADDPARMVADYGHKTGRCGFCQLPLSDPNSTAVGYGQKCASNWN